MWRGNQKDRQKKWGKAWEECVDTILEKRGTTRKETKTVAQIRER